MTDYQKLKELIEAQEKNELVLGDIRLASKKTTELGDTTSPNDIDIYFANELVMYSNSKDNSNLMGKYSDVERVKNENEELKKEIDYLKKINSVDKIMELLKGRDLIIHN